MRVILLLSITTLMGVGDLAGQSASIPITLTVIDPPPDCSVSGSVTNMLFGVRYRPFPGQPDLVDWPSSQSGEFTMSGSHSMGVCGTISFIEHLFSGSNRLPIDISYMMSGSESGTIDRSAFDYGGCFTPSDGGGLFTSTSATVTLTGTIPRVTTTTPLGTYSATLSVNVGCG